MATTAYTSEASGYSGVELQTLWLLTSGKDGKLGKGKTYGGEDPVWTFEETQRLEKFVERINHSQHKPETKQWKIFFEKLGSEARCGYLGVKRASTYHENCQHSLAEPQKYVQTLLSEQQTHTGKGNYKRASFTTQPGTAIWWRSQQDLLTLDGELFSVFQKDPSPYVRARLAALEGIPHGVAMNLSHDKKIYVLTELLKNSDICADVVTETVLTFEKITKNENRTMTRREHINEEREKREYLCALMSNPVTPQSILLEKLQQLTAFNAYASFNDTAVRNAYAHPAMPKEVIVENEKELRVRISQRTARQVTENTGDTRLSTMEHYWHVAHWLIVLATGKVESSTVTEAITQHDLFRLEREVRKAHHLRSYGPSREVSESVFNTKSLTPEQLKDIFNVLHLNPSERDNGSAMCAFAVLAHPNCPIFTTQEYETLHEKFSKVERSRFTKAEYYEEAHMSRSVISFIELKTSPHIY